MAETAGDAAGARVAYEEAWAATSNDFERCIAAHYVPRVIDDAHEKLRWNEDALAFANAVGDERVTSFLPSLHAGVGMCLLDMGDAVGAVEALEAGMRSIDAVPEDAFRQGLSDMIGERLAQARALLAERPTS